MIPCEHKLRAVVLTTRLFGFLVFFFVDSSTEKQFYSLSCKGCDPGHGAAAGHHEQSARMIGRPKIRMSEHDSVFHEKPVMHRGCLHWLRWWLPRTGVVVSRSEEFRQMRGPRDGPHTIGQLVAVDGELGASLLAEYERTIGVWVLENYGEDGASWACRHRIDVSFLQDPLPARYLAVAHVSAEGDALILTTEKNRYGVYNLGSGEVVSGRQEIRRDLDATWFVYQENFVSLAPKRRT